MMGNKIKEIVQNRWFKFSWVSVLYLLIFVVWGRNLWFLIGLVFLYDYYISQQYKKLFWNKHTDLKHRYKFYGSVMGWIEAIVFAVIAAMLLRTYFVEMYVIPSPSMENTLLVGDYIGVSKISYGPKMPNTPLSFPLVHNVNPFKPEQKSYLDWITLPYKRLKGLNRVKNNDVIVFNFPQGDTVLVASPQSNYYEMERKHGKQWLESQSEIIYHPVDKRDNYIKRAVGIPSDILEIKDGDLFVNGASERAIPTVQHRYQLNFEPGVLSQPFLEEMEINFDNIIDVNSTYLDAFLTFEQYKKFLSTKGIVSASRSNRKSPDIDVFPYDTAHYGFSAHNFGPIEIPQRGKTVSLDLNNLSLYSRIIDVYEGNDLWVQDSVIYINNLPAKEYTFAMDYYFAMGDNRDNSLDSRYFGFIPEDHIVGKASFIWFSSDKTKSFPKNIRFDRILNFIK